MSAAGRVFAEVIDIWSGRRPPASIRALITDDYVGHMLHLEVGERSADEYRDWIERYRREQPGTEFEVVAQTVAGDRIWSRLVASRSDGAVAHGMNQSRVQDGKLAEEWAIWSSWRPTHEYPLDHT